MDQHRTALARPFDRSRVQPNLKLVFGEPNRIVRTPLAPRLTDGEDRGTYWRRKLTLEIEPADTLFAWVLTPKREPRGPSPVVICVYGTTSGAGKDTTVGLSGPKPGSPPRRNRDFAVDMVNAGFIAIAPDLLRDGERIARGRAPYDTADFYDRHPNWSIHGKDAYDIGRLIDWLEAQPWADTWRIGLTGHSYGGHTAIFTAALEPRIRAVAANGAVSDFVHHGLHWAVPPGARSSQSMPLLRPFLLAHATPPLTFAEVTSMIAPRPLWFGQAAGERRPMDEESYALVERAYREAGAGDNVRYVWYAGDHDFPQVARRAAVEWFRKWFGDGEAN
jgi:hypothetical protein